MFRSNSYCNGKITNGNETKKECVHPISKGVYYYLNFILILN